MSSFGRTITAEMLGRIGRVDENVPVGHVAAAVVLGFEPATSGWKLR